MGIARLASCTLPVLLVLLAACATPAPQGRSAGETAEPTAGGSRTVAGDRVTAMLRDTAPRAGVPRFVGFSPRLRNREEETAVAVTDAAREAVRYLAVRASVVFIARQSSSDVDYAEAVEARIDEGRVEQLEAGLEVLERVQDEEGTAVLVAAPDLSAHPPVVGVAVGEAHAAGARPTWIEARPIIPGFDVGVGVARRLRSREDSVAAADEEALAEIVLERAARVRAVEDARDVEGVGTTGVTTRAQEAADVIRGFYVLSRYRGAGGRYYYSLAVARRSEPGNGE